VHEHGRFLIAMIVVGVVGAIGGFGLVQARDEGERVGKSMGAPAGNAFTYQGQLKAGGNPVDDTCEMAFRLYDQETDGSQVGTPMTETVGIAGGLFSVKLDFGANAFDADGRWLGIRVQCPGDLGYTDLGRQEVTPAPQALYALDADRLDGQHASELLPRGVIVMWSGSLSSIPEGWALCDGGEYEGLNTPDLRDSFVYGVSEGEDPGATGGAATHSHAYSDVPRHNHTASSVQAGEHRHQQEAMSCSVRSEPYYGTPYVVVYTCKTFINTWSAGNHSHTITIDYEGEASPATDDASTLPPYYKVAFIIKL
jgi:microcystin-dependent protein